MFKTKAVGFVPNSSYLAAIFYQTANGITNISKLPKFPQSETIIKVDIKPPLHRPRQISAGAFLLP
jgi:hypothetical protein